MWRLVHFHNFSHQRLCLHFRRRVAEGLNRSSNLSYSTSLPFLPTPSAEDSTPLSSLPITWLDLPSCRHRLQAALSPQVSWGVPPSHCFASVVLYLPSHRPPRTSVLGDSNRSASLRYSVHRSSLLLLSPSLHRPSLVLCPISSSVSGKECPPFFPPWGKDQGNPKGSNSTLNRPSTIIKIIVNLRRRKTGYSCGAVSHRSPLHKTSYVNLLRAKKSFVRQGLCSFRR